MVEPSNALQESISRKGQHSYYYAHAPRDLDEIEQAIVISGDNIVTGGPPKLVETTEITQQQQRRLIDIRNYSWNDEDENVVIYITLQDEITRDQVNCIFQAKGFELECQVGEYEMRKLVIRNLYDEINTDISCIRVRRNRIRVILVKKEIKTWYSLTSNK